MTIIRDWVLQQYSQPVITLELTDAPSKDKNLVGNRRHAAFEFAPDLFLENSTGKIEWRSRTPHAKSIADALKSKME